MHGTTDAVPPWDWEALLLPFRDPTSGRWCLGVADQETATLIYIDTTPDRGWLPDTQLLDWLEESDPDRRPWGQNTLAGRCYSTSVHSSGVIIPAYMTQVAR